MSLSLDQRRILIMETAPQRMHAVWRNTGKKHSLNSVVTNCIYESTEGWESSFGFLTRWQKLISVGWGEKKLPLPNFCLLSTLTNLLPRALLSMHLSIVDHILWESYNMAKNIINAKTTKFEVNFIACFCGNYKVNAFCRKFCGQPAQEKVNFRRCSSFNLRCRLVSNADTRDCTIKNPSSTGPFLRDWL